ncbi:MAG: aminotransferase class I/II-fold pyridoxal phosphate-dependent enzyme [Desulfobacteraceae bacterium]|nr:aminotransferase class I/II-fold pyridoxal phosphate-dependent enzyme [Desulfobacteraceae bacterium]
MANTFIHKTAVVDDKVDIGSDTRIWHFSHVLQNSIVGQGCSIGQNVVIGPDVKVGNNCKIQNNVSVYKGVTLEDDVFCGPSMVFTNVFNPRSAIRRMDQIRPTLVKKGASLGANSTIICGVTIGKYSFVGAGAVVTKDVPDHALVKGNPAKQTGWICECGEKINSEMICCVCQKEYQWLTDMDSDSTTGNTIAFVDLAAQQKIILPEIEKNIQTVLQHGQYIMGPEVKKLETQLAKFAKVKHAVTCSSGTDALIMALMAYGIGYGDAVFTTPFTFIATAEAIRICGATPVFVDIDPGTFNISVEKLKKTISDFTKENHSGLKPKAIIPVDLFGLPCDYDGINMIAKENDLIVIEDAAQSFGAEYKGRMAGGLGHIGCTSFFPAKPLGCYGDGGAVFTDSDEIAEKVISMRIHGKGSNKYDNVRLGINGRLDTIQAAILLAKIKIFPNENQKRREIAKRYTNLISLLNNADNILLPGTFEGYKSAWAQYSLLLKNDKIRSIIQKQLKASSISSAVYYPTPLHLQTAYRDLGYKQGDFPMSEDFAGRVISIPMHPYLKEEEQLRVVAGLNYSATIPNT